MLPNCDKSDFSRPRRDPLRSATLSPLDRDVTVQAVEAMRSSPSVVSSDQRTFTCLDEFGHGSRAWREINERTRIGRRYFASFIANGAAIAIERIRRPSTTTVIADKALPSVIGADVGRIFAGLEENLTIGLDKYVTRNAGADGPRATARDTNLLHGSFPDIELAELANELRKMRAALKVHLEGDDPEKIRQIGVLASAERAARNGDGTAAERHLRQATEWIYLVALSIGAKRAADVIARLIDL
jgi:hypothetical protein